MRIQDPGWKKFGSGINIPDLQHCKKLGHWSILVGSLSASRLASIWPSPARFTVSIYPFLEGTFRTQKMY
jgi:hypothetical protein